MGNDNNHDSKTGLISILLLILFTTGTLINPLTSSRPHGPQSPKLFSPDVNKVDARLWQDPIAVVEKHIYQEKSNESLKGETLDSFRKKIEKQIKEDIVLKIIAVSVFGGSYSELIEYRQRYRYAVVSALGAQGFSAQDTDHLNFIRLETEQLADDNKIIDVPYEWFERNSHSINQEKTLILWLNEDKIDSKKYGDFINELFTQLKPSPFQDYSFTLIGPTRTSLLVELMKQPPIHNPDGEFKIISSNATISDCDLLKELNAGQESYATTTACELDKAKAIIKDELSIRSIIRSIGQDKNLANALIWELWQRGVKRKTLPTNQCGDGLILISEQDSLYARTLSQHIRDAFLKGYSDQCPQEHRIHKEKPLFTNFTYLRGLDGKLPVIDKADNEKVDKEEKKEGRKLLIQPDDSPPEHAEGRNQFDYLRRLVDTIEELDRTQGFGANRIKAIGIIGSDVYDKLLILHALQDRFRNKIFFTTDLDARYLHADQIKWSRNLIVASNFDFTLRPELQNSTMPFRDSYQTSMYLATLLALDNYQHSLKMKHATQLRRTQLISRKLQDVEKKIQEIQENLDKWLKPQIFEIGRTHAVHLASLDVNDLDKWMGSDDKRLIYKESSKAECRTDDLLSCPTIETDRYKAKEYNLFNLQSFFFIIVVIFLFFSILFYRPIQEVFLKQEITLKTTASYVTIFVISFLILLFLIYEDNSPSRMNGEPFLWTEGVSVWPNIVIRFLGITVIILIILFYFRKLTEAKRNIQNDFEFISMTDQSIGEKKSEHFQWTEILQGPYLNLKRSSQRSTRKEQAEVEKLWQSYMEITDDFKSNKYFWIITATLISLCITCSGLFIFGYLNYPARGEITQYLHIFFIFLQFGILWSLVFWVGYEVAACRNFINCLDIKGIDKSQGYSENETDSESVNWPPKLMRKVAEKTGIPSNFLGRYIGFLLITRAIERINGLIYIPFVLMLLIAIGRSNIFDNLGFSPALIVVFISALIYLILKMSVLRTSAKNQCDGITRYYEEFRSTRDTFVLESEENIANTEDIVSKENMDMLVAGIRSKYRDTFTPFIHRPTLLAILLPGGGIGLIQIIEYLYNN